LYLFYIATDSIVSFGSGKMIKLGQWKSWAH